MEVCSDLGVLTIFADHERQIKLQESQVFIPAADFCGRTSVSSVCFFSFPKTAVFGFWAQNSEFLCVNKTHQYCPTQSVLQKIEHNIF